MTELQDSILFFDSGVGGLTVLAKCVKALRGLHFTYFGDNGHAPYGNLPSQKIEERVFALFESFQFYAPRAVVIACNTVTAICAEKLRVKYAFPIIGTEPAVFPAARSVKAGGEVYVLSTRATFESERFQYLCARAQRAHPHARIRSFSCDALAGEIERNIFHLRDFDPTPFLPKGNPSAVVLGCTHYAYLKNRIEAFYNCPVYDSAEGICKRISSFLGTVTTQNHDPFFSPVSFVGDAKTHNQSVFEQTFGLKWGKLGALWS